MRPQNLDDYDSWEVLALCRAYDASIWFTETEIHEELAKSICARCPVRVECLRAAMTNNEKFGIWGGTTPKERVNLRRKLKRAGLDAY